MGALRSLPDRYLWIMIKVIQKPIKNTSFDAVTVAGKSIMPHLQDYQTGWSISITSPFTGKTLLVKEDGQFIELPAQ